MLLMSQSDFWGAILSTTSALCLLHLLLLLEYSVGGRVDDRERDYDVRRRTRTYQFERFFVEWSREGGGLSGLEPPKQNISIRSSI